PASPYRIASGLACGAANSVTPLLGMQFLLSAIWALAIRGNVLAAAIGTFLLNPWTMGPIWVSSYEIGAWMLAGTRAAPAAKHAHEIDFSAMFTTLTHSALRFDVAHAVDQIWPIWFPMMAGSIPMMAVVWLSFYFPVRAMVRVRRDRRRQHLAQRLAARRAFRAGLERQGDPSI
ncbi:MAG: DUF2062 domain-containing protein, partial [Alphaproteobacteria bacterium]